jgi:hypothetical protein
LAPVRSDVLLAEVTRRKGTDPTRDNAPEIVAELFAGTRVELGFGPAVEAAECWRPDLIVFEQWSATEAAAPSWPPSRADSRSCSCRRAPISSTTRSGSPR